MNNLVPGYNPTMKARAELRKALREATRKIGDAIDDPCVQKLSVIDFLCYRPNWQRKSVLRFMYHIQCSEYRLVGELTDRQKQILKEILEKY